MFLIFLAASLAIDVGLIFYISTLMYVGHPGFMLQTDIKNKKKYSISELNLFKQNISH